MYNLHDQVFGICAKVKKCCDTVYVTLVTSELALILFGLMSKNTFIPHKEYKLKRVSIGTTFYVYNHG